MLCVFDPPSVFRTYSCFFINNQDFIIAFVPYGVHTHLKAQGLCFNSKVCKHFNRNQCLPFYAGVVCIVFLKPGTIRA